jgi:cytochrome c oxidase cbb3-type subunit IV
MSPELLAASGIVRGIVAAVLLLAFLALWLWAYSARRRVMFDAMAQLPLEDDAYPTGSARGTAP